MAAAPPLALLLALLVAAPAPRGARGQLPSPSPGSLTDPTPTPTATPGGNAVTFVDSWSFVNISTGSGRIFNLGYYNVTSNYSRCERLQFLSFNSSASGLATVLSLVVIPTYPAQAFGCTLSIQLFPFTAPSTQLGSTWVGAFTEAASASAEEWASIDVSAMGWNLQKNARYDFRITTSTWSSTPVGGVATRCLLELPFGTASTRYALVGSYGKPDTPCNPTDTTYTTDPAAVFDGGSILFALEGVSTLPSATSSPSAGASASPSATLSPTASTSAPPSASPTASLSTGASPSTSPSPSPTLLPAASGLAPASSWPSASPSPSSAAGSGGANSNVANGGGGSSLGSASAPALVAVAVVACLVAVAALVYVRRSNARVKKLMRQPGGKDKIGEVVVSGEGGGGGGGGGGRGGGGVGGGGGAALAMRQAPGAGDQQAQLMALIQQQQAMLLVLQAQQQQKLQQVAADQAQQQPASHLHAASNGIADFGGVRASPASFAPQQAREAV